MSGGNNNINIGYGVRSGGHGSHNTLNIGNIIAARINNPVDLTFGSFVTPTPSQYPPWNGGVHIIVGHKTTKAAAKQLVRDKLFRVCAVYGPHSSINAKLICRTVALESAWKDSGTD